MSSVPWQCLAADNSFSRGRAWRYQGSIKAFRGHRPNIFCGAPLYIQFDGVKSGDGVVPPSHFFNFSILVRFYACWMVLFTIYMSEFAWSGALKTAGP